ncbi:hypothetical protein ACEPAH_7658 [Sanghuangporus vaninii]
MSVWALMNWSVLHEDLGYAATGRPHPSGLGVDVGRSEGMEPRGKNHMYNPDEFQFNAYTPPPDDENDSPYEFPGTCTIQPWFPFVWLKQSVETSSPVSIEEEELLSGCVHPSSVCKEILFSACWFTYGGIRFHILRWLTTPGGERTPSMISISPSSGQF